MQARYCFVLIFLIAASGARAADTVTHYAAGSQIAEQAVVQDKDGRTHSLRQLVSASGKPFTVLFIFGGGGLGHEKTLETGGLWCPDSFAEMRLVQQLVADYKDKLGFVLVAVPPVYHAERSGYPERVFFDKGGHAEQHQAARAAFVASTEGAVTNGTIPLPPFYDMDFNFLIPQQQSELRQASYAQQAWHGAFRAPDETQHYGVPNLWLVDSEGRIASEPFRGNVYHGDESELASNYTLEDVVEAIEVLLKKAR